MTGAVLTVEKVNAYISRIFEAEELLHEILVAGEISGFSLSGTTAYFTLKDERAAMSCVCFDAAKKGCLFRNGDRVLVRGTPNYYARLGRLSFLVSKAGEAAGQGSLFLKYAALREKLEREGKFDPAKKRPLPRYAATIGVVTSRTGAVIHDIITVARRRNPAINIVLSPVKVQGVGAEREIADGIRQLARFAADVIIVARGGGSAEDIEPFYTEAVVNAVADCPVPVISAVGHETDVTLCDYAADVRAATPSVAAELCTFSAAEYEGQVRALGERCLLALTARAEREKYRLRGAAAELSERGSRLLSGEVLRMKALLETMYRGCAERQHGALAETERARAALEALNPESVLRRGYALVARAGKAVPEASQLRPGDPIALRFADGTVPARVEERLDAEEEET